MWLLATLCLLPPVLCFFLLVLQQPLLQAGVLNTEDLTIAAGRRGMLGQELLNLWTWDAAMGLSCVLSLLAVPVGIMLLVNAKRPVELGVPADRPRD